MADEKKEKIHPPDVEKEGAAVQSVTENVPHPADATSAPGPYEDLDVNREGVSTNQAPGEIAQTLVAGAGAPQPPSEDDMPLPEDQKASSEPLTAEQKKNAVFLEGETKGEKK